MMSSTASRLPYVFVLSVLLCGAAACSGKGSAESPLAPSSPAGPPASPAPPATSGATIAGRVTGLGPGLGTSSFRVLGSSGATVTVVGTSLSAPIGSDGSFSISGVPSGEVTLQFSASGTDARVTVSAVVETEHIELTVSVSGSSAVVVTIQRVASDNRAELEGNVTALAGVCPAVTFTVSGTTVVSNAATEFGVRGCGSLGVGAKVEVKGTRQTNGSVLALKVNVEVQTVEVEGIVSAASGTCPAVTFTVNGTTVVSNAATEFGVRGCGSLGVGAKVEVKGTRQTNGSLLALKVNVEVQTVEVEGKVGSLTGICPALTFSVNGTGVTTSSATQFKGGACGSIKAGTKVGVNGARQANGTVLASRVEISD